MDPIVVLKTPPDCNNVAKEIEETHVVMVNPEKAEEIEEIEVVKKDEIKTEIDDEIAVEVAEEVKNPNNKQKSKDFFAAEQKGTQEFPNLANKKSQNNDIFPGTVIYYNRRNYFGFLQSSSHGDLYMNGHTINCEARDLHPGTCVEFAVQPSKKRNFLEAVSVSLLSTRFTGTVKFYHANKKFGYIACAWRFGDLKIRRYNLKCEESELRRHTKVEFAVGSALKSKGYDALAITLAT